MILTMPLCVCDQVAVPVVVMSCSDEKVALREWVLGSSAHILVTDSAESFDAGLGLPCAVLMVDCEHEASMLELVVRGSGKDAFLKTNYKDWVRAGGATAAPPHSPVCMDARSWGVRGCVDDDLFAALERQSPLYCR
jgi:hypothetical protein